MEARVIRLQCGEQTFEVGLSEGREGLEVTVAGTAHRIAVEEVAPGVFVLAEGDRRETFHCVAEGDAVHLCWRGRVYELEQVREGSRRTQRHAQGALEAPMPGKVITVKAEPGQRVAKGDELLVVESMKMENALRAPREGVVKAVHARPGDMVTPGVVLVELE
jgi:3-methylcrotonyl-CoA carboxylase alpha subunit